MKMKLNIDGTTLISAEVEENEHEIIVPDGVKIIAEEALAHHPFVTRIILPDSVHTICNYAFQGDVRLTELTLPIPAALRKFAITDSNLRRRYNTKMEKATLTVSPKKKGVEIKKRFYNKNFDLAYVDHVIFGPGIEVIDEFAFSLGLNFTTTIEFAKACEKLKMTISSTTCS